MSLLEKMHAYRWTSSWAVWPRADEYERSSDIRFPDGEDLDGVLHARTVILGLNRGWSKEGATKWGTFHTPGHNDHMLAEAFRDTQHWGGYMTDLLSEVNSKSNTLDWSADTVAADVADLVEELKFLEVDDPLFILIGKDAASAFDQRSEGIASALGLPPLRSVKIPHYSSANGATHGNSPRRFRDLVHAALDS